MMSQTNKKYKHNNPVDHIRPFAWNKFFFNNGGNNRPVHLSISKTCLFFYKIFNPTTNAYSTTQAEDKNIDIAQPSYSLICVKGNREGIM